MDSGLWGKNGLTAWAVTAIAGAGCGYKEPEVEQLGTPPCCR